MKPLWRSLRAVAIVTGATLLAPACSMEGDEPSGDGLENIENASAGAQLFNQETFGGNGRTCATCHPSSSGTSSGTLNPKQVQALFKKNPNDPLFRGDGADTIGGHTFNRIQQHATVLINLPLPDNVTIAGSSDRTVTWARGIPTTMDTPALDPVLMYDGRDPDLQTQARGAIEAHAGSTAVTQQQLNDIADFQRTLFNRSNLKAFAQNGTPLVMPQGTTDAEKRGRRWFIDDNKTSVEDVGESKFNVCGFCHSGPMLNGLSAFFVANIAPPGFAEGDRFFTVLVSEFNRLGNPTQVFQFHNPDGSVTEVESPDLGLFRVIGEPPPIGNGFFKIPTCWGIKDTAPYFHDNSAKDIPGIMRQYKALLEVLGIPHTDQDITDMGNYLKLL